MKLKKTVLATLCICCLTGCGSKNGEDTTKKKETATKEEQADKKKNAKDDLYFQDEEGFAIEDLDTKKFDKSKFNNEIALVNVDLISEELHDSFPADFDWNTLIEKGIVLNYYDSETGQKITNQEEVAATKLEASATHLISFDIHAEVSGSSEDIHRTALNMYLKNHSDKTLTVKECFEKGWWLIEVDEEDILHFLTNADTAKSPTYTIKSVIEVLGDPSTILVKKDEDASATSLSEEYVLVYEYDDITLAVTIEKYIGDNGKLKNYYFDEVEFFSPTQWKTEQKDGYSSVYDIYE